MAEIEYPIHVPVVDRTGDVSKIIGEAKIDADGNAEINITDEKYARALQPPAYSLSLPFEGDEDHIIRGED
ncbi:hypothetical protein SscP1EGY_20 [Streptomyces phage SscP1EGY]|nr:hypothetical protein SscP1EGY_20 [Streptomyces phage SscP1EGY]